MPLSVRCKSKQQAALATNWPPGVMPCSAACAAGSSLFQGSDSTLAQSAAAPIIVQAPAPAAPIIIQSPPVFFPMPSSSSQEFTQSQSSDECGNCKASRDTNSKGTSMPVIPAPDTASDQLSMQGNQPNTQSDMQAKSPNSAQNPGPPQPIIINIHNSQDTASHNRSLFAPEVSDDSITETRVNLKPVLGSEKAKANATESPVPVVKVPLPETSPGASADTISPVKPAGGAGANVPDPVPTGSVPSSSPANSSPASDSASSDSQAKVNESPNYVMVRHGRLVHLRPVRAIVASESSPAVPARANTNSRLFHYVGWS